MKLEIVKFPFHNDIVDAFIGEDGQIYVVAKRIAELFGLDWSTQRRMLREAEWSGAVKITLPDANGCGQKTWVIPAESFPREMAGNPSRPGQARDVLA